MHCSSGRAIIFCFASVFALNVLNPYIIDEHCVCVCVCVAFMTEKLYVCHTSQLCALCCVCVCVCVNMYIYIYTSMNISSSFKPLSSIIIFSNTLC